MNDRLVVGIDNGLTGGMCALCPVSGNVVATSAMPVKKNGKRNCLDLLVDKVVVEESPAHAPSAASLSSMSISFGKMVGAFEVTGFRVVRVQVRDWQREMLGRKIPKGATKPLALAYARRRWPDQDWLASARCKTPHDGIVDAALIALYGSGLK
jgi:hypothetical protein